ncbi:hypothetical protein EVAR_10720_1 [Eumeta japonica]|uniref:SWIM-type domain-containing protein n=1 Tax=Eumeta variegata TaxID=151549 RepID=A0A4C1U7G9_EUMVA|nr:hypothetical protein EVAR_10720_1 [Eumeta japonica]
MRLVGRFVACCVLSLLSMYTTLMIRLLVKFHHCTFESLSCRIVHRDDSWWPTTSRLSLLAWIEAVTIACIVSLPPGLRPQCFLEVVEIRDSGGGFIHGKVTPQTRVNNRPYDVKVEVNLDRTVRRTECTCKAGLSVRGCKHVAAVCILSIMNVRNRKPINRNVGISLESQVEKYKKVALSLKCSQYIQSEKDIEPLREEEKKERRSVYNYGPNLPLARVKARLQLL